MLPVLFLCGGLIRKYLKASYKISSRPDAFSLWRQSCQCLPFLLQVLPLSTCAKQAHAAGESVGAQVADVAGCVAGVAGFVAGVAGNKGSPTLAHGRVYSPHAPPQFPTLFLQGLQPLFSSGNDGAQQSPNTSRTGCVAGAEGFSVGHANDCLAAHGGGAHLGTGQAPLVRSPE